MGIIWFNVPEAYEYLMKHGEVFTLRDHPKKEGKAMLRSSLEGKPYYKGMVTVDFVREVFIHEPLSKYMLHCYVSKSGFKSVEEWLSKLDQGFLRYYLFHVRKI